MCQPPSPCGSKAGTGDGGHPKRKKPPPEGGGRRSYASDLPLAGPKPGRCQISCVGCICRKPRRTHAVSDAAPSYSQTSSLDHLLCVGPRPAVAASVPRRRRALAPGPSPEAHRPDSSPPAPLPNDRARSSHFVGPVGRGSHAVPVAASVRSFSIVVSRRHASPDAQISPQNLSRHLLNSPAFQTRPSPPAHPDTSGTLPSCTK